MTTNSGKPMLVDYAPEIAKEKKFDFSRMKSHFSTCPAAEKFRKDRTASKQEAPK